MSISMSILSILDDGPSYGQRVKNEFETRTGGIWPLNVGQVYTTMDRLERDGLIRRTAAGSPAMSAQNVYAVTDEGRAYLKTWFSTNTLVGAPARDELVLKVVMAARHPGVETSQVIQAERKGALQQLQEYTRIKSGSEESDLGWTFLLDSLIFQMESRVRWLDACEERLARASLSSTSTYTPSDQPSENESEVAR